MPIANDERITRRVLVIMTGGFVLLAAGFVIDALRARPLPSAPPKAANPSPATVRISAGELRQGGGDTSMLDCYACHDEKKTEELTFDAGGRVVLPKEHADLIFSMRNCTSCHGTSTSLEKFIAADGSVNVPEKHKDLLALAHGRNNRNNHCFNCHNPARLDQLVTRDGTKLKLEEATLLCASCHGPTYRDWETGVHGRTTGHWDKKLGATSRAECASCHDPHAPAFPKLIPFPAPYAGDPTKGNPRQEPGPPQRETQP